MRRLASCEFHKKKTKIVQSTASVLHEHIKQGGHKVGEKIQSFPVFTAYFRTGYSNKK